GCRAEAAVDGSVWLDCRGWQLITGCLFSAAETRQQHKGVFVWLPRHGSNIKGCLFGAAKAAAKLEGCLFGAAKAAAKLEGCLFRAAEPRQQ
nr:hypothetical protein [Tanacetum cinerariifolium]